jgi:hypothetical protein
MYKAMSETDSLTEDLPECLYAKPMSFNFNASNVFDYKSLTFLLYSTAGKDAYAELQSIERMYLDLAARHEDLNDSAIERQKESAELHQQNIINEKTSFETIVQLLGPELSARLRDHLRAVVIRIELDEQRYLHAYRALIEVLDEYFGEKIVLRKLESKKKFEKENLPPLPAVFQTYLEKVKAESA